MNGGNNISLPLESIDQLFALVRKQQFENLSLKEQVLETVEARRQGDWDHTGLLEFGCLDTGDEVDVLKIIEQSTLSDEDRLFVMKECGLAKN